MACPGFFFYIRIQAGIPRSIQMLSFLIFYDANVRLI